MMALRFREILRAITRARIRTGAPMWKKLVRDNIADVIREHGGDPHTYEADDREYAARLRDKLTEEVCEYLSSGELEELADLLEVAYALAQLRGFDPARLEQVRAGKAARYGAFTRHVILIRD
jgi:predicted house-cleaning noncanonical NTP pyrophosphatase (MazG superfamily)